MKLSPSEKICLYKCPHFLAPFRSFGFLYDILHSHPKSQCWLIRLLPVLIPDGLSGQRCFATIHLLRQRCRWTCAPQTDSWAPRGYWDRGAWNWGAAALSQLANRRWRGRGLTVDRWALCWSCAWARRLFCDFLFESLLVEELSWCLERCFPDPVGGAQRYTSLFG